MFDFYIRFPDNRAERKISHLEGAMPQRTLIAKELAALLGALAHPHRIRIVEELRQGELDVNSIQRILEISHSGVSQNLAILRSGRLVQERREGRHVYYRLTDPALATWILEGLRFLEAGAVQGEQMKAAAETVKEIWGEGQASSTAR